MGKKEELIGRRFGRLVVIGVDENDKKPGGGCACTCVCDCGKTVQKREHYLRKGSTKSCGCYSAELASERARNRARAKGWGCGDGDLRQKWRELIMRCFDEKRQSYKNYGGRGITVCEEWKRSFDAFKSWALQNGYKEGFSLDRIDVNGNYEPKNCRWIEKYKQARNKRNTVYLTAFGKTQCLSDWLDEYKIKRSTVTERIKRGWDIELAIATPPCRTGRWKG